MLSGDANENSRSVGKIVGLISNKKQLCTFSTLFLVHFLGVVFHDFNKKLPETS